MAFNSHWISPGGLNKIYLTLMDLNVQYILAAVVVQKFYLMANGVGRLLTNLLLLKLLDLLALFCLEQGCCFYRAHSKLSNINCSSRSKRIDWCDTT